MLSDEYIGAVLDLCGCFYMQHAGKYRYLNFRIVTNKIAHKKVIDLVVKKLKKEGIDFSVFNVKKGKGYFVVNKKSMENLNKFMKKHCMMREIR